MESNYKATVEFSRVVIPQNQDRDDYVKFALRSNTVCVMNDKGQFQKNCPVVIGMCGISGGIMKSIEFPETDTQLGSIVACLNVDLHDVPIVIGVLRRNDANLQLDEEYQFLVTDTTDEGSYMIEGRGLSGLINLFANGSTESGGKINISAHNTSTKGEINLSTDYYFVKAKKKIGFVANEEFELLVRNLATQDNFSKLGLVLGTGLIYEDEFENKIYFRDDQLIFENKTGTVFNVSEGVVNLADENGNESAALGDTLKGKIDELIGIVDGILDAILLITVTTPAGVSIAPPLNSTSFISSKTQLATLKAQMNEILSSKVKLS